MPTYSGSFSGRSAVTLNLSVSESSLNSAANTSVVSWTLYVSGNSASYNNGAGDWAVNINGVTWSGNWTYDFRSNNTPTLASGSTTVTHNGDGSKSVYSAASASDNGGSPLGSASAAAYFDLTNFAVLPSAPGSAPTISRNSSGTSVTLVSAVASSPVTLSLVYR